MSIATEYLGKPTSRVDGPAKVTGEAKYAAEFNVPNLAYGYIVSSGVTRGTIKRINAAELEKIPGVLKIFTHENAPKTAYLDRSHRDQLASSGGSPFRPLYKAEIEYSQQPVALVVAETFEVARYAASLIQVEYETAPHETDLRANRDQAHPPVYSRTGYTPPPKEPRATPWKRTKRRLSRWKRSTASPSSSTTRWRILPPPASTARTANW